MSEIDCKFCGVSHVAGADGCSGYPNVSSATTRRAEEIRETTGMAWEYACLQAERERDAAEIDARPVDACYCDVAGLCAGCAERS